MEMGRAESGLERRLDNYIEEELAIRRKLENNIPEGKRERLEFRLKDLKRRLIPKLVSQIHVS